MKILYKILPGLCICLAAFQTQAQNAFSQKLFAANPETVMFDKQILSGTFTTAKGNSSTIYFSPDFQFSGTVVSNESRYANLQVVIMRSITESQSLFQISRITNKDNSITFAGRILNHGFADGYEIKQNADGNYFLQKISMQKIFEPCNL